MSDSTRKANGARGNENAEKVLKMAVVMVNIMNSYKRFRYMNASYYQAGNKSIFFRSYNTDVLYIDVTTNFPYISFLEYTGVTTQRQITTFLRSNLLDSISDGADIERPYRAALKWARDKGYRGKRISLTAYQYYMVISVSAVDEIYRVSYDGKTLKKI